jgi:hypothetical protein
MKRSPRIHSFTITLEKEEKEILTRVKVSRSWLLEDDSIQNHAHEPTLQPFLKAVKRRGFDVRALWDTGSDSTLISARLAEKLPKAIVSYEEVNTANGTADLETSDVTLQLPNGIEIAKWKVFHCPLDGHGFDVIIGMDVIKLGELQIMPLRHLRSRVTFKFASQYLHW